MICRDYGFEKRPMLYNGVFGCHGNMCYVIFIGAIFFIKYSTGQINVFEINRFRIDEVRKYACIFYLTSRDTKRYVVRHGDYDTSDRYFDKEHFETNQKSSGSKVMAQIVVFVFSVTLTLTCDLCSIFLSHTLRMMNWNIHAKFH